MQKLAKILILAVLIVGCGETPKTRFPKGKDNRAKLAETNRCGEKVAVCTFESFGGAVDTRARLDGDSAFLDDVQLVEASPQAADSNNDDFFSGDTSKYQKAAEAAKTDAPYGKGYVRRDMTRLEAKDGNFKILLGITDDKSVDRLFEKESADEEKLAREVRVALASLIEKACFPRIKATLTDEVLKTKVNLKMIELVDEDLARGREVDLRLAINRPLTRREDDAQTKRLILAQWPFHSDLYPVTEACDEKCAIEKSEPFCRSLAKLVSHKMGVNDPVALEGKCGEAEPVLKNLKVTTASNKPGRKDFWEKSKLSPENKSEIFRVSTCPQVERVRSNGKNKNKRNDDNDNSISTVAGEGAI